MLSKRSQTGVILLLLIIVAIGVGIYFYFSDGAQENKGRVVFAITDDAKNLEGVSQIMITVDTIEAHSTTDAWVALSNTQKTYDLLELKSQSKLEVVSDTEVAAGTYDQVRMHISKVVVVDAQGEHEAKLPSNELKINTDLEVKEDATATATFDFIADESLHITGNGMYILAPVVQVETRSNTDVEVDADNTLTINGGTVKQNKKVGMDAEGNVDVGLTIPASATLDIDTEGMIKVNSIGVGLGSSGSANANTNAQGSANANANAGGNDNMQGNVNAEADVEVDVGY
jgi:hypothetical protein